MDASGGAKLGPYTLLRELRRSGLAVSYLAEDARASRTVVVKVVRPSPDDLSRARELLEREAGHLSRLDHPGVCALLEVGEIEGQPYLALQYVEGETLAERLQARGMARASTSREELIADLQTFESLARTLHHVHEAGIVHGNVKPANILIPTVGQPVLLDFELAFDETTGSQVKEGELIGTPIVMAPEQIRGMAKLDRRIDVFGLGCSLYKCLTLRYPFEGKNLSEVLDGILNANPLPARSLNPGLPRDVEQVILHALEKNPDERYRSGLEMAEDLRRLPELMWWPARPVKLSQRIRRWMKKHLSHRRS